MSVPQITITQAANELGVAYKTALSWVHNGTLRAVKIGGRFKTTGEWIKSVQRPVSIVAINVGVNQDDDDDYKTTRAQIRAMLGF